VAEIPEPVLDHEERAAFDKGVREFNQGYYFECHDTLEELWSGLRGPSRDFFQGLIQVSVGYYHLGGGNLAGAASMFARALKRFEKYPERYFGFDLEQQRRELRLLAERLAAGAAAGEPGEPPRWHFDSAAADRLS
jgi:predicted metal-dependent hydrolase